MFKTLLAFAFITFPLSVWAQTCGPSNPNCLVPIPPQSDNSNRAAPTKWVKTYVPTTIATNFASPPPLGNITPNSVFSTTLSATGLATLNAIDIFGPGLNGGVGSAPLYIQQNPTGTTAAGANSIFRFWVGNNPVGTPAPNGNVLGTLYIDNLNGRGQIWLMNPVHNVLDAAHGGTIPVIAHGFEFDSTINAAPNTPTSAYTTGNVLHDVEHVASANATSATAVNPQVAEWVWAAGDLASGQPWWNFGYSCARVQISCFVGENYGSDVTLPFQTGFIWDKSSSYAVIRDSGTHTSVIDLEDSPVITNFILGSSTGVTVLKDRNNADFINEWWIDAGKTVAQQERLTFGHKNNRYWSWTSNSDLTFSVFDWQTGNTVLSVAPTTDAIALNYPVSVTGNLTTSANVIWGNHAYGTGTAPGLSACGGGSPSLSTGANDSHGTVTEGTTATGCVVTFHAAYTNPPDCTVSWHTQLPAAFTYTTSTSALTVTNTSGSGGIFTYLCQGH